MSKEVCGKFCAQYSIPFIKGDVETVIEEVKRSLEFHHVFVGDVKIKPTKELYKSRKLARGEHGVYIDFFVSGLNYTNRNYQGTTIKPITKITCGFRRELGFSSYELLKELESQGKKNRKNADFIGYDITFWTDSQYRRYRHKTWCKLEGKNHYTYNDDCRSREFLDDISSYLTNLVALKNR